MAVIAVTQACCEPVLQTSTEQWGMQRSQDTLAGRKAICEGGGALCGAPSAQPLGNKG